MIMGSVHVQAPTNHTAGAMGPKSLEVVYVDLLGSLWLQTAQLGSRVEGVRVDTLYRLLDLM